MKKEDDFMIVLKKKKYEQVKVQLQLEDIFDY